MTAFVNGLPDVAGGICIIDLTLPPDGNVERKVKSPSPRKGWNVFDFNDWDRSI